MHMNYDFTPIFVGISSCLVRIPGRLLAARQRAETRSPTPSRSPRSRVLCSPLHRQPPPAGCGAARGPGPPLRVAAPAPSPLSGLGQGVLMFIYSISPENVQWIKTDLGVKLKKQVCAVFCRGRCLQALLPPARLRRCPPGPHHLLGKADVEISQPLPALGR